MTIAILLAYLVLVLAIGMSAHRLFRNTGEDYFVANRSLGPFVLLMTLFGTHMTAFTILGASGEAYRTGIGVFSLMASSSALIVPTVFLVVGTRLWSIGKRFGYVTQVQYFRERWGSDALGLLLFVVLICLLIPYVLISMMAGGIITSEITAGAVPAWLGNLAICLVVLAYVEYGGMRGTAWANTFQTLVFMSFGAATVFIVVRQMGGLGATFGRLASSHPELLVRGNNVQPLQLLSYTLLPLSAGMFPHLFIHWLTARRAAHFRYTVVLYPLFIAVVWVPSVLLGVLGNDPFPGLAGPEASSILLRLIDTYSPGLLAGLLAAGVFSACMNSVDSQVLALGNMFTHDIVRHYGFHDRMSEAQQVRVGRLFVAGILVLAFFLSLVTDHGIFRLGVWSFTGFASLFPIAIAALYWRRSTRQGAIASVLGVAVLWLYFFLWSGLQADGSMFGTGLMPVAVILPAAALILVIVSLLTPPPDRAIIARFFPASERT
jgi:SSS family solute:Na+ symporter